MNSEKIIKPANGYLMVVITIALFILGIVMCINEENGFYLHTYQIVKQLWRCLDSLK